MTRKSSRQQRFPEVALRPAFVFTCENCGEDCYINAVEIDLDESLAADLHRVLHQVRIDALGVRAKNLNERSKLFAQECSRKMVAGPSRARCGNCNAIFSLNLK